MLHWVQLIDMHQAGLPVILRFFFYVFSIFLNSAESILQGNKIV